MAEQNNNLDDAVEQDSPGGQETVDLCQELNKKCQICPNSPSKKTLTLKTTPIEAGNDDEEVFLYDPEMIQKLDFTQAKCKFNPQVSAANPGEGLQVRPLGSKDYERGFLEILGQLTSVGSITKEQFLKRFDDMRKCANTYYITVIVDTKLDKIIGSGTIVHERKFIHDCGSRGIIEDIIVSNEYRGKQLGKIIIASLIEIGRDIGCYKITLNCKDELIKFYNSFGLVCEPGNANFMMLRIPSKL